MYDHMTAEQLRAALLAAADQLRPYTTGTNKRGMDAYAVLAIIQAVAARLSGMAADTWQPMETAPKKGRIALWIPSSVTPSEGYETHGCWSDDRHNKKPQPFWDFDAAVNVSHARSMQPTHWRAESEPPRG